MLKKLRHKKTAKKIWIVLAILILPAFVLWGTGSMGREKTEAPYAGKIFGKKISLLEYKDAMNAVKNDLIMQSGGDSEESQEHPNLEEQAWNRIILLSEARRMRIKADDAEVIALIQSYPFFQHKGSFDDRSYEEALRYVFRTQPRIFEEETRQNIILNKLYKRLTEKINLDPAETEAEYRKLNQQISIFYIAGLYADFQKEVPAGDKQLKDYYTDHSIEFKQPLSFNIEYVSVDSPDKINQLRKAIKNKKDGFAEAAKKAGFEVKDTGLFAQTDPIPGIGWSAQITELLAKARPGEFLPVLLIDKRYCLVRLKQKKEPYIPDFNEIKEKIKEKFIKHEAERTVKQKIDDCLKTLDEKSQNKTQTVDFNAAAKACALKTGSAGPFKYGSYIEGIGASDKFWTIAEGLKETEYSGIIEAPSGLYIIKLKAKTPLDKVKFESEKEEFSRILLLQKKMESFAKFLEGLKRRAQ